MQKKIFKFISLCLVLALTQLTFANYAMAQDERTEKAEDDSKIQGKVFDSDQDKVLEDGSVRIVNTETGESHEDDLDKGKFCFDDLVPGTYTLTYIRNQTEYLLADKLTAANKTVVATCTALGPNNTLVLMTNIEDEECTCKKGLPIGWILLGGAAAVAGGIAIGGGEDPEASPSQP